MSIRPQGSAAFGVEGDGGSAAFGGVAPIYAPSAALSLAVYLFSPLVEDHEVLDWELRATERDAAIPAVPAVPAVPAGPDTPAIRDIYADNAETSGLRISLLEPAGAAGNAWRISRGVNSGAIRFESVADLQRIRLAGELFNNVTTFGQLLAAANAVTFISAAYFGGATAATTIVSSGVLIPGGGGLFHGGADGTPAVPEVPEVPEVPAEPISATVDEDNRAVLLRLAAADVLGDIKPVVDAVEGLGSAYQGGVLPTGIASRGLPWTQPFSLLTVVGGPEGPEGMLTDAARQEVEAARDAARAARDASLAAQQASETARDASGVARDASAASAVTSGSARDQAEFSRDAATAQAVASQASSAAAGVRAAAAAVSADESETARTGAEAAQAAAEAARDAAQAQTGFTAALTEAVTGNEETGIDVTVDDNGKLNFVVTGGGTPPVSAHARYLALTTADISTLNDADRAAAFLDETHGATSETEDITIPVFTENLYLTFTRQADLAAPTFIGVKNGQNQIGGFIQLAPAHNVVLGGVEQALWEHVDSNGEAEVVYPVLSGTVWTIR